MKKLAQILFKYRSYTPIPFVVIMLIFYNGNVLSWAAGSIVLLLGEAIRLWAIIFAGSLTRTTTCVKAKELVTCGPYSFTRNPLYIGNVLIYVGFGIITYSLFPYLQLVALAWFIFQYILIIGIEEEFLAGKFGEKYSEYKKNTPRFFPKFISQNAEVFTHIKPNFKKGLKSEIRTLQALMSVALLAMIIHLVK